MCNVNWKRLASVFLCNAGVMEGAVGVSVLLYSYDCTQWSEYEGSKNEKWAQPMHQIFLSRSLS